MGTLPKKRLRTGRLLSLHSSRSCSPTIRQNPLLLGRVVISKYQLNTGVVGAHWPSSGLLACARGLGLRKYSRHASSQAFRQCRCANCTANRLSRDVGWCPKQKSCRLERGKSPQEQRSGPNLIRRPDAQHGSVRHLSRKPGTKAPIAAHSYAAIMSWRAKKPATSRLLIRAYRPRRLANASLWPQIEEERATF